MWSGAAGAIPAVGVVGARRGCDRRRSGPGTICLGRASGDAGLSAASRQCRRCGIRTERLEFADPRRGSRRLRRQIGVDCQSMPTSHAAVRHGVSSGKARRGEGVSRRLGSHPTKRRPRHIGLDEIQRGKGQRFWTVLSDVVHGEVMGLRQDRSEGTATAAADGGFDCPATCRDHGRLHGHASAVSQCGRRGAEAGGGGLRQIPCAPARQRGTRRGAAPGILSRRRRDAGNTAAASAGSCSAAGRRCAARSAGAGDAVRRQSAALQSLRAARATRSPLDLQDPPRRARLSARLDPALRWQRLPEMERLATSSSSISRGSRPTAIIHVRFGVVESINTTIKAVLRRARGMRDEEMLLLKLKWATAHPIRSARDLARFLNV